jgi:hypothetical protein
MKSYRFARRSFLRGVGAGAVGLRAMLRSLEAIAQGVAPPPRFLMTHWPVGTIRYLFPPTGTGPNLANMTLSSILKPFQPLVSDMILLTGLQTTSYHPSGVGFGGGHEAGTPQTTTGAIPPGTRSNGGENDDAVAGGPSWDQIFLKNVPSLQTQGQGYANAICDARVDSKETSTQCLSYGYATRSVAAATGGAGGQVTENTPLLPTLSPLLLYQNLFSGMMPGGGGGNVNDMAKLLKARRSVLDYSISELGRMRTLAPGIEAREKIDVHTAAIRRIEMQLTTQINNGTMTPNTCTLPAMPDASLLGKTGSRSEYMSVPTPAAADDSPLHEQIGKAHMGILKAAFICDLVRVGTFQWSPGTNHVSFKGLFPNAPNAIYMHHPTSHIIGFSDTSQSLPGVGLHQDVVNFLAAVQTWYNQKMADILLDWKATTDVYGGNLLANTIIPYVTEVGEATHSWGPMPGYIFGGSALGMKGGQYLNGNWPMNSFWLSIAQAYFKNTNPLASIPTTYPGTDTTGNTFVRTNAAPIPNLWAPV